MDNNINHSPADAEKEVEAAAENQAEAVSPAEEGRKSKPPLSTKKKVLIALAAFFLVGTIVSGFFVLRLENDDRKAQKLNESLAAMLNDEPEQGESSPSASSAPSQDPEETPALAEGEELEPFEKPHQNKADDEAAAEPEIEYLYRFHALIERYEDFVGWISIGDDISLPVVQSSDNEYYLDHDIEGNENRNGAIFMDYENNPIDLRYNTYLYGHHYLGGKEMFAALDKYNDNSYALLHNTFYFATVTDEYECIIFSKYRLYPDNWRIYAVEFEDDDDYQAWIDERLALSECDFGVSVTKDDIILSLSTCDYTFDGAREIIHAVLVKK